MSKKNNFVSELITFANNKSEELLKQRVLAASEAFSSGDLNIDDYYLTEVRLISVGIAGSGTWKSTNFTYDALKKGVDKFNTIPLLGEHWKMTTGAIVLSPVFQEATRYKGKDIPAGINAIYCINKELNPDVVLGMKLGSIKYNSIAPIFTFTRSIPELYYGEFDKDGNECTRNVIEITFVEETSFVLNPADKTAKRLNKDGVPLSDEDDNWFENEICESPKKSLSLHMEKFKDILTKIKFSGENPDEDAVVAAIAKYIDDNKEKPFSFKDELGVNDKETAIGLIQFADETKKSLVSDLVKLSAQLNIPITDAEKSLYMTLSFKDISDKLKSFSDRVKANFAHCNDCNSKNIRFSSSKNDDDGNDDDGNDTKDIEDINFNFTPTFSSKKRI